MQHFRSEGLVISLRGSSAIIRAAIGKGDGRLHFAAIHFSQIPGTTFEIPV